MSCPVFGTTQVAAWDETGAAAHSTVAPSVKDTAPVGAMAVPPVTVKVAV